MNITTNKVEANAKLGPFTHPNGDGEEIIAVEKAVLAHPEVQAQLDKLQLPPGSIVVSDPWIYGTTIARLDLSPLLTFMQALMG